MSKRKLSETEIQNILSEFKLNPYIPKRTAKSVVNNLCKEIKKQLEVIEIYPSLIDELKKNIFDMYINSIIQPGETVGIITAQSIGEKQTQSNLNTFHKAGSSDKQPVTSKFGELLNATSKPKDPTYWIYFKHNNENVSELRNAVSHSIVQLTVKKLCKNICVCLDRERQCWYDIYDILYCGNNNEKNDNKNICLSLEIDMNILYEYKLTLKHICDVIEGYYLDAYCVFSPDSFGIIDIYPSLENIEFTEEKLLFVTKENFNEIYLEEVVQPLIENIIVCGIPGILNMFFLQEGKEWIIETENSRGKIDEPILYKNSKEKFIESTKRYKMVLSHPLVDFTRTISNNVWDIYNTLGIEAVRQFMIDEFSQIMEGINICHVMLLVDKMTFKGTISSISRYTMRTEDTGPFGKASFEETLDNFMKAGVFGQEEPTEGVSASIICGKRARIGTGLCDLAIDIDKLINFN